MACKCTKIAVIITVIAVAIIGVIVGLIVGVVLTTTENACETLRAPTHLRIDPVNNFLTISWAYSTDDCADHYEVVVEMNGVVSSVTRQVPFHYFEHTAYCTEVNIAVTRVAGDGRRSAPASLTYTRSVSPGFGTVTDLTLTRTGGANVMVRWVGPTGFDQCIMKYKVTVEDEASLVERQEIEVTLENLEYCTNTTISVVPVIDGIEGTQIEEDTILNVPTRFAQVTGLTIGFQGANDDVLVTWSRPEGFDACTITYQVTVDGESIVVDDVLQHPVSLADMLYCESKTVHVVPMVGPIEGISTSVDAVVQVSEGFAHVLDLTVNYPTGQVAFVAWSRPPGFDECDIIYQVTVPDGQPQMINQLQFNIALTGLRDCDRKTVHVLPVVGPIEGIPKSVDAIRLSSGFAPVLELAVTYLENEVALVTWSRPADFEECTIEYQVTVDEGEPIVINVPKYEVLLEDLADCEKRTVHVLPVVGPIEGASRSVNVVRLAPGFAPVLFLDVQYLDIDNALVTWIRPAGFEQCTIQYQVTVYEGESRVINLPEYPVSLQHFAECESRTVHVRPVVGPIKGQSRSVNVVRLAPGLAPGFAPVLYLDVAYPEMDKAIVTWTRPAGFEECTIEYQVSLDEGEPTVINVRAYVVSLEHLAECGSKTVHVLPVVGPIKGESRSVDAVRLTPGFPPVLFLAVQYLDIDNALVTWIRPAGFEQCTIQYQVTVDEGESRVINLPEYPVSLQHFAECESRTVHVRPVVGPIKGESRSVNVVAQNPERCPANSSE